MTLPETYQKLVAVRQDADLTQACEVQTVALEPPQAGEVIVKTHYAGVNAADYLMVQGRYLRKTPPPFDLGAEAVGEVVAVGAGVERPAVGDHVLALEGGYKTYFATPAKYAIPIPQASADVIALGISGLTASIALEKVGEMSKGETVFVTAAAGGTGNLAVQIAKLAGNTVIGTCSSAEKIEFLRSIGCDRPINYREDDVNAILKAEFPDGIDIAFESVGGELFDIAARRLAVHGRLIAIGAISEYESGPQSVTRPRIYHNLLRKSASVRGFWLIHYLRYAAEHIGRLSAQVQSGALKLPIDDTHFSGLTGAVDALKYLYSGQNIGKVVIDFTD